nr:DNA helicase [Tanacetum cinerariifolium]
MSREAWVRSTDASDLVHGEVMSLRTTVLSQMTEIRELHAADRRRQTMISELLRTDHRRSTEITEDSRDSLEVLHGQSYQRRLMATSVINNSVFRGFFEKQKLTGPNFIDWYKKFRIVLSVEDKLNYLEHLIHATPVLAQAGQEVAPEAFVAHDAWVKGSKEIEEGQSVSSYVLKMKSYIDNIERLGHPVTTGLGVSLILISLRKEFDDFVQNYNMHNMGKKINELHAMLKLHEQTLTKNNAPALHAICAGKVQKAITSRLQQNPGDLHWTTVKNILEYLRNIKDCLLFTKVLLIGYVFATSSVKAEYIAAFDASKEVVWVRKFISRLEITKDARHFRAKVHYLCEVIEYGDVKLEKVHTYDNLADPFTKALAFPKHSEHTKNIGMFPASSLIDPTGVFVLPFGGVSAYEEMLNLLGVPSANCRTDNTRLYLNVFQKCFEFCGGNLPVLQNKVNRGQRRSTVVKLAGNLLILAKVHKTHLLCRTKDVKLYSDVYQKYRQGCKGVSQKGPGTISKGTPSTADVMCMDCESQKLMPTDVVDVFQAYSALCSRGIRNIGPSTSLGGRNARGNSEVSLTTGETTCSRGIGGSPSLNVRQTITVSNSNFIDENDVRNTGPSTLLVGRITRENREVGLTTDVRNTGPSILRDRKNTRVNPEVSLTTGEATCSMSVDGRRSVNVCEATTFCGSNFIHNNDARNTDLSTSRGGRNIRVNPGVTLTTAEATCSSDINRCHSVRRRSSTRSATVSSSSAAGAGAHTLALFLETLISVFIIVGLPSDAYNELVQLFKTTRDKCMELDIPEFKIRLYNGQGARGYEFPASNTIGAMVFESEIKRFMAQYPEMTASDRADVVCQVFERKIQSFVTFLKEERIFGNVTGVLYTVEFQKRGLPHCHTLLWVDSESKTKSVEDVDQYILAELPDPRIDPDGYNIVSETMMPGPCGAANMKASCMKGDKCGKSFPKKFNSKTFFDDNGHAHYQRRDISITTTRNQFKLDNNYVVSYNRDLLLAFRAHINVEYCGWSMLIKYLFKYISKGTDRIFARVSRPIGRFICAHEAYYRIFKFDIHHREPVVQILAMYLEDMQRITFRDKDRAACEALGLLGDDREWETTLEEACASATSEQLRFVFSHILLHCDVAYPSKLWTKQELIFVYDHGEIGIASLLLPSGRTAHSKFKLPLELTEESLCRITENTQLGKLLADTDLIIWDEAPMNDHVVFRHSIEASEKSLTNRSLYLEASQFSDIC